MKFYSKAANLILLTLMLSIVGCSALLPKPKFDANDPNSSVVFGYIDLKTLPSEFGEATIHGMKDDEDYVTADTVNGAFWHIAVRPGYREVSEFSGFTSRDIFGQGEGGKIYKFPKGKSSIAINIKTPGVHFMGSYRYVDHKEGGVLGFFSKETFEVIRTRKPSEKTVLKMIFKAMKDDGSGQYYPRQMKMIKKRIAELR